MAQVLGNPTVSVSTAVGAPPAVSVQPELYLDSVSGFLYAILPSGRTVIGPASAGTGTVTNNEGILALGQIVIGNGGADEQTLGTYGAAGQVLTSAGSGVAPVWSSTGAAANFADSEVPSGTINGANTSFIVAHVPLSGSVKLYLNGIRQQAGGDYTIVSNAITMTVPPSTGDILLADYRF